MMLDINPTNIIREIISTGRLILEMDITIMDVRKEIIITTTGTEIGKVTAGIITVGKTITGTTIRIHTGITNIIITIIITDT